LWIVIFAFMMFGPPTPHGLFVSIGNRQVTTTEKSPWPESVQVYVRAPNRFFVNGEEIGRGRLYAKLIEKLGYGAPWAVYFEADFDTRYLDPFYAIDTIQGCGAKVIWITPGIRKAWQQKAESVRAHGTGTFSVASESE
jgi:biopolymer transport protein ExbD